MRFVLVGLTVFLTCSASAARVAAQKNATVEDVVAAELAFSRAAGEIGMRDAFAKFVDDDGVLFRPRAVNGKKFLSTQPNRPGLLQWRPSFAIISAAGDMGFTTGPWTYQPTVQDTVVAWGDYDTVWLRQPSGEWKYAIDMGNSHDRPAASSPSWMSAELERVTEHAGTASMDSLARIDAALTSDINAGRDLSRRVLVHSRVAREGMLPQIGAGAVQALSEPSHALRTKLLGGRVAQSGDLAYTYGEYAVRATPSRAAEEGNYMRIWTRAPGNAWKLAVDVHNPIGK
jgi:ketosteroid isomerase-like protein